MISTLDQDSDGYTNIEDICIFFPMAAMCIILCACPDINAVPDSQPPTTPTNLTATAILPSQINLSWSASSDNIRVLGHRIYHNGTQIATVADTAYPDTNLLPQTLYSYTDCCL